MAGSSCTVQCWTHFLIGVPILITLFFRSSKCTRLKILSDRITGNVLPHTTWVTFGDFYWLSGVLGMRKVLHLFKTPKTPQWGVSWADLPLLAFLSFLFFIFYFLGNECHRSSKTNFFCSVKFSICWIPAHSCQVLPGNLDLPGCADVPGSVANSPQDFLSRTGLLRQQLHSVLWSQFIIWRNRRSPSAAPCVPAVMFQLSLPRGGCRVLIVNCAASLFSASPPRCWQVLLDQFSATSWAGMLLCDSHRRSSSGPKGKFWVSGKYSWRDASKWGGSSCNIHKYV